VEGVLFDRGDVLCCAVLVCKFLERLHLSGKPEDSIGVKVNNSEGRMKCVEWTFWNEEV